MSNENRFTQQVTVLDLVINCLTEREKTLSSLIDRIEAVADRLEKATGAEKR